MSTQTLWNCPTDWVTQDKTLQINYPSAEHPTAEITTGIPGGLKWVFVPLGLSVDGSIKAVRVCYQLSSSSSFIARVRLIEIRTPGTVVVRHDDPTDLLSTVPTCHVSAVSPYRPEGAVTLALWVKFADATHRIRLGPVGLDVETCGIDVANVKCFGAVGDGVADDTAPMQNAIDAVEAAGGGTVYFPTGAYLTSQPLRVAHDGVAFRGAGRDATVLQNSSSDLLHISTSDISDTHLVKYFGLEDIQLKSLLHGGHLIVVPVGMGQSTIRAARLIQRNNDKSIYRLFIDTNNDTDPVGRGGYNNVVTEAWLQGPQNPTVPQWHVVVNGALYNSNTFERMRCDNSGAFFFHLESTRSQAPLSGNGFRDVIFERCVGGKIKLLSCVGTLLQECVAYDDNADDISNDGFYVGRSPASLSRSTYTTFINCDRRSGNLRGIYKDIKLAPDECQATTVINCGGTPGAGITHDFGDTPLTAIGMPVFVTFEGTAQTTMVSSDGVTTPS
jgi:Pectate lyase superfamily protein